jgi:hypothetical protein
MKHTLRKGGKKGKRQLLSGISSKAAASRAVGVTFVAFVIFIPKSGILK